MPQCPDSQSSSPISVCDTRVCVFSRSLDQLSINKSGLRWFLPPETNRHFWLRTRFAISHQFKEVVKNRPRARLHHHVRASPKRYYLHTQRNTLLGKAFVQELMYRVNNSGDKTQPWGPPVELISLWESDVPHLTCWVLLPRKSTIR